MVEKLILYKNSLLIILAQLAYLDSNALPKKSLFETYSTSTSNKQTDKNNNRTTGPTELYCDPNFCVS